LRKSETMVSAIVEESQLTADQRDINEINSAIYCFTLEKLWPALAQVKPNNKHRELYLTDAISVLTSKGETVLAQIAPDPREILGCNTRADLAEVDRVFREWKRNALMDAGVTIQLPETVLIDPEVVAGEDTTIESSVQLLGKTKIGARCIVKTGSVLVDAILGDDVTIEAHCVIAQSRLDDRVIIGPFARLRPDNHLKTGVRIGNFVELKKSTVGEGTKAMHLSYLGDAKIGSKTNIGAGTITCNYDGFHKYPTTIGNKVFVGSDSALVAPVKLGDGAYVAAGSTITENVPADALGIARGRQVTKPHWASKKRRQLIAADKPTKSAHKKKSSKPKKKKR
jgi:bifunctional UDP-N-acetylglucosamine pyrophosphorylase/glucosamine-1-phosphate N-acetyltransferase